MTYIVSQNVMHDLIGIGRAVEQLGLLYAGASMSDEDVASLRSMASYYHDELGGWLRALASDYSLIRTGAA